MNHTDLLVGPSSDRLIFSTPGVLADFIAQRIDPLHRGLGRALVYSNDPPQGNNNRDIIDILTKDGFSFSPLLIIKPLLFEAKTQVNKFSNPLSEAFLNKEN